MIIDNNIMNFNIYLGKKPTVRVSAWDGCITLIKPPDIKDNQGSAYVFNDVGAAAIPTLSQWGMIIFMGILLLSSIAVYKKAERREDRIQKSVVRKQETKDRKQKTEIRSQKV